jgi:phosphomannomutase
VGVAVDAELRAKVEAWIADDPDPVDRAELMALLDHASADENETGTEDEAGGPGTSQDQSAVDDIMALVTAGDAQEAASQLEDRFADRLTFGTAGLRGQIGAGPNRMNRAVVRAATSAVAAWLRDPTAPRAPISPPALPSAQVPSLSVVVGCDARHRSAEFAAEAARVLAAAGIRVHGLPRPCPTPLVAFAVRHLAASAGIMITASHNPRTDNGYKLYLSDGAQVIPPVDADIEARIVALSSLLDIPTAPLDSPFIIRHGGEVADAYLSAITGRDAQPERRAGGTWPSGTAGREPAVSAGREPADPHALRVVYTPMHGVAGDLLLRAVQQAGFPRPHVVTVQAQPDPDFPTAAFPNPEEPTALTLALADAKALDADLVLANDPDGDRLAVAVPEPDTRRKHRDLPGTGILEDGRWRILTGDQVGALLGAYLLAQDQRAAPRPAPGRPAGQPLVATTIVSSTMLSKIAAKAGAAYRETLTGFKWIARAGDTAPGTRFVFGYEEAIGYTAGTAVRDKDGIGAAVAFLRLATDAARAGQSVLDLYDDLEREHGVHLTSALSLHVAGTAEVMRRLRTTPPASLGGQDVDASTDYSNAPAGGDGGAPPRGTTVGGLPPSDVLSFQIGQDRVVIRPSGTEPKIKAYIEVVEPVPAGGLTAARLTAQRRLHPLRESVNALLTGKPIITDQRRG